MKITHYELQPCLLGTNVYYNLVKLWSSCLNMSLWKESWVAVLVTIYYLATEYTTRQCWFREWLGAVRQQTIAWTNVECVPWSLMVSPMIQISSCWNQNVLWKLDQCYACLWPSTTLVLRRINRSLFITSKVLNSQLHVASLTQDCSNSSALAMELLQSCTTPVSLIVKRVWLFTQWEESAECSFICCNRYSVKHLFYY